jgi:hypothetical protein
MKLSGKRARFLPGRSGSPLGRRLGLIFFVLLTLILASGAYAFTALNNVQASKAGDGHGTIGSFTLSNIVYTYNAYTPMNIDYWEFDLGATASQVRSKIRSSDSTYVACSLVSGTRWRCDPSPDIPVSNLVDQLRVIAVQ